MTSHCIFTFQTLQQEKSNLAQPYRTGRNCGLGCSGGLLLGIFLFSIGMVLVISQHQNGSNFTSYDCSGEDNSEGTELFTYSLLISLFMVFVNLVHLLLTFYGFKALLGLKSNYQKFRFTDVFYCLSCIGSIILLSFSIVSAIAVIVPDARFYNWEVNRQMFNSTVRVLELDTRCATSVATGTSWANLFYITTDIIQIFVCSAFVVQAGQMLPHGNVSKNKKLSEIIQFLGITHFFLWIVTSFIYAPNLDQFYFVEELYFGASTFAVIARVTYPFIIFYHFTTAMRCIALFYQYDSLP
ncbi:hypothetical protein EB796_007658 [Bugula neritina]|uniref:Uncharacterized protein n=1 Tax=Bugula neritina TaxID=10212 RepID=A0A7J7K854_BUGNE|nr:hypothetical protein EB796_007658 [Bugula neritina]